MTEEMITVNFKNIEYINVCSVMNESFKFHKWILEARDSIYANAKKDKRFKRFLYATERIPYFHLAGKFDDMPYCVEIMAGLFDEFPTIAASCVYEKIDE